MILILLKNLDGVLLLSNDTDVCTCDINKRKQAIDDMVKQKQREQNYTRVTEYEYGHRPRVKKGW